MIKINCIKDDYTIHLNIPTDYSEITPEYLESVTKGISISTNHVLIGIVHRATLMELVTNAKKNKITTAVIPVYVKSGKLSEPLEAKVCDQLIIAPTDISRGYHVVARNNKITMDYITKCITEDKDVYNAVTMSRIYNNDDNKFGSDKPYCYFLEFKLVPACDIHGVYGEEEKDYNNPFVTIEKKG